MGLTDYLQYSGKADAFATLDLFTQGLLFFGPEDLQWDGSHHILHGLRINEGARDEFPGFWFRQIPFAMQKVETHIEAFVDLLLSLEADERLRVPDRKLHRIVNQALGKGDITGMSLVALAACNRAWWLVGEDDPPLGDTPLREALAKRAGVELQELSPAALERVYVAAVDERLLRAVPGLDVVLWQLVGDLREYNELEGPHVLVVGGVINHDADCFLDQFKGSVFGATKQTALVVGSLADVEDAAKQVPTQGTDTRETGSSTIADSGATPEAESERIARENAAQASRLEAAGAILSAVAAMWEDEPIVTIGEPQASSRAADSASKPAEPLDPTGRWTFSQHTLAKGTRFSVEVPDGFAVLQDFGGRVFVALPADEAATASEDDTPECVQIYYSGMADGYDEEAQTILRENGVPEYLAQLSRHILYGNTVTSFGGPVNDWIVEGENGQVMVYEMKLTLFGVSYEYYVAPIAADHHHMLRLADSFSTLKSGELRSLALAIARTVEFGKPMRYEREEQLERWLTEPATADELTESGNAVGNMLARAGNERINADGLRAKARAGENELVPLHRIFASAYTDSLEVEGRYLERYVDVLRAQRDLVDTDTYERMWKVVGELIDALMVEKFQMEDNDEFAGHVNDTGLIHLPSGYPLMRAEYEALAPAGR